MSTTNARVESIVSTDTIIGENVHQLMWRARETQTAIAPLLGITQSALSHKLRGNRPWYSSEIQTIATHFNVSVGDLFTEGGPAGGGLAVGPAGLEPTTSTV